MFRKSKGNEEFELEREKCRRSGICEKYFLHCICASYFILFQDERGENGQENRRKTHPRNEQDREEERDAQEKRTLTEKD